MPRFCANLSMLFTEHEFTDRFKAAAEAGFRAVEYLFPYDYEPGVLSECLRENDLIQVLHNLPSGDWSSGERGIACLPGRTEEFQEGVGLAIDYATALGCRKLNCLAGIPAADIDPDTCREVLVENLKFAARATGEAGIKLMLEPLNSLDVPGFYLTHSAHAMEVINAVQSDNLFLQYDIYHMQIMEGDLARTIQRLGESIGHMQLADNPGRHEPGTGEINYNFLFDAIDESGYQGWIGCEYIPSGNSGDSLAWFEPYRSNG